MQIHRPKLTRDPLFLGATRPPMRWGVTYTALLANLILTLEVFLISKNLLVLAAALPVHGLQRLLCARDPRIFDLLFLHLKTRAPHWFANARHWHAASYSALPLAPAAHDGRRTHIALHPVV
jgi:type IV secretion system protein VirB3